MRCHCCGRLCELRLGWAEQISCVTAELASLHPSHSRAKSVSSDVCINAPCSALYFSHNAHWQWAQEIGGKQECDRLSPTSIHQKTLDFFFNSELLRGSRHRHLLFLLFGCLVPFIWHVPALLLCHCLAITSSRKPSLTIPTQVSTPYSLVGHWQHSMHG